MRIIILALSFFFFYSEQFLTKSYPITRKHNKRGHGFLFLQKTLSNSSIQPRNKASSSPFPSIYEFHADHPVYIREKKRMDFVHGRGVAV